MAKLNGIKINISDEADKLREQWAAATPRPDVG